MTKIFVNPSSTLPGFHPLGDARGRGKGGKGCASINAVCRKRELQRIAMENKHLVKDGLLAMPKLASRGPPGHREVAALFLDTGKVLTKRTRRCRETRSDGPSPTSIRPKA